jgi:mRNA interferase HigB
LHRSPPLVRLVWIKWIGTHRDYDRIDVKEVEHDG